MAGLTNEQVVGAALRSLSADQPEPPADRMAAVHRRHRRRRALQGAAMAGVVAILAVAGVAVGSSMKAAHGRSTPPAALGQLASWQLPWPTRDDGTVDKQQVVHDLEAMGYRDLRQVHWLYAGTPVASTVQWAVLEARFASTDGTDIDTLFALSSGPGANHWRVASPSAPPVSTRVIGFAERTYGTVLGLAAPGASYMELLTLDGSNVGRSPLPPVGDGVALSARGQAKQRDTLLIREKDSPSSYVVVFDNDTPSGPTPAWWNTPAPRGAHDIVLGTTSGGTGSGWGNLHSPIAGRLIVQLACGGPTPFTFDLTVEGANRPGRASDRVVEVTSCDGLYHSYDAGPVQAGDRIDARQVNNGGVVEAQATLLVRP
jgi:hypothetical protein